MFREPLLLPATGLAAGICLAHLSPPAAHVPWHWFSPVLLGVLVGTLGARVAAGLRWTAALIFALSLGAWTETAHHTIRTPKLNAEDGEVVVLAGCVSNPPVFSPERAQFTLELKPGASARMSVNIRDGNALPLRYGQRVEATAKIRRPRNFGNPGAFDYAGYLAAQGIFWTGSVSSASDIKSMQGWCGSPVMRAVFDVRTWALERIRSLYPNDPQTAALLAATLMGETAGMEKRWTNDFRVTGTYHALVISGQHVSVLAGTLLLLLSVFGMRRIPALAIAAGMCWFYAALTGFSAPVMRAAGAFTLFLIASTLFRRLRVLNVLAVVSIAYLVVLPHQLFDPSFQLSFLSAAAIAVFALPLLERTTIPLRESVKRFDQTTYATQLEPAAAQWRVELHSLAETIRVWTGLSTKATNLIVPAAVKLAAFACDAMAISACVQFGLALPMIAYFHRLSITGLSANVIVIPTLDAVVPLGFAALLTGWGLLATITRFLLALAENVAFWHAHFEPAYRVAAVPVWSAAAFAGALVLLAWTIRKAPRWSFVPLFASLGLFALLCFQPWKPRVVPGELELTAIDVGQGDSILLVFPNGATMLVDAGGFPGFGNMRHKPQMDIGEDVISPYLWTRRIKRLDYAVLTHGHSDHMGGLAAILDNFRPQALWIGTEPESPEWKRVREHAAADGTRVVALHRGSPELVLGGATVRVLSPAADYVPDEKAQNNDSLVLEISYGGQRMLLTGDAEAAVESELVGTGSLRPVTLLKVGHHGSKTSSTEDFLSALQPGYAFISDGYMNQFHHPHPTVLERLETHHVRVFRTDLKGQATFLTDGNRVEVRTFY